MKKVFKYFAILSIAILSLTSCSSDDNASSVVLLKKLHASVLGDNEDYSFIYNGTKLTKISFVVNLGNITTGYSDILYTGDLITQVKDYDNNNQNTYNTFFTYNEVGKLTQVLKLQVGTDSAERTDFTYNTDNTVDSSQYRGTVASQTYLNYKEKFYFENNQLIKKDYTYITSSTEIGYTYDTANRPMKNVMGIDAVELYVNSFDGFLSLGLKGVSNNIVKEIWYSSPGVVMETINFDSVYNDDNYPVSISSTMDSPGNYDYNYEYYN